MSNYIFLKKFSMHYQSSNIGLIFLIVLSILSINTSQLWAQNKKKVQKASIEWVKIRGGSFMMGDENGYSHERPRHYVVVKDFYMSKTEISVKQYKKCVDAGVCTKPADNNDNENCNWGYNHRENHPINCVDWEQARIFAKWIGGDLPSEIQWEYAARSGGKDIKYPWGNTEPICDIVNFDYDCHKATAPVCSKSKIGGNTAQGLCDMAGNVEEWVLDEWHNSYQDAPSNDTAWCSDIGCDQDMSINRVCRGGSWNHRASGLYVKSRMFNDPNYGSTTLGFRIAYTKSLVK